ncbi:MAG: hypothetical protein QXF76_04005 [Candidatus Anstonellales archaeon]
MNEFDIEQKGFDKLKKDLSKKVLKEIDNINKPVPDTKLNFFENIKAQLYIKKMEAKLKMFEAIKKILLQKIVQWIMKIGGTWIVAVGVSQNSIEEIVGGALAVVFSAIWSLIQTGKIALTDPKDFLKVR